MSRAGKAVVKRAGRPVESRAGALAGSPVASRITGPVARLLASPVLKSGKVRGLVLALLAVGALLCLLIGIRQNSDPFDEGYSLYGAQRILYGEVPYRDFWLVYAPAQFYVLAAIFKLFGASIMIARIYDTLVRFAIVVLMYRISAKLTSPGTAIVSALVGTLALGTSELYCYAVYPALALSLLALWFLLRHLEAAWGGWPLLCGLAVGAATLFRHDIGFYDAVTAAAVLAASSWFGAGSKQPGRARVVWRTLCVFAAGVAVPVVPVLIALVATVPAHDLWFDLVVFPAQIMNAYRSLPYPPLPSALTREALLLPILFYFPIYLFLGSIVSLLIRRRRWGVTAMTILGILYFKQGLNLVDQIHLLPATLIVALLAPTLLFEAVKSWRRVSSYRLIAAVAVVAGAGYVIFPAQDLLRYLSHPVLPANRYTLPRGLGIETHPNEEEAIRYVRDHTAEGERIFVANYRHDKLVVNDILFYFLAERPCGTRYHDLTPGVVTTLEVQREIISELEKNHVRTVAVCSVWEKVRQPNESARSTGVLALDEYLKSKFDPVAEFPGYFIAQRVD